MPHPGSSAAAASLTWPRVIKAGVTGARGGSRVPPRRARSSAATATLAAAFTGAATRKTAKSAAVDWR
jgi:hypothetical protein